MTEPSQDLDLDLISLDFVPIPVPTQVTTGCNLCDRIIHEEDGFFFVRVRDAAFVCKACRKNNPEKDAK